MTLILLIILALLSTAFFQGVGIAFPAAAKIPDLGNSPSHRILSRVTRNRLIFDGIVLTGSALSLVLYGLFMAELIEPQLRNVLPPMLNNNAAILTLQIILSTIVVIFTAEALPGVMLTLNPLRMVARLAIPFYVLYVLLFPLAFLIVSFAKLVSTKVLRLPYAYKEPAHALINLSSLSKYSRAEKKEGHDEDLDTRIIHNALEFKTVLVRECMIPRT